jgi:DNA-binding protein HU-beta
VNQEELIRELGKATGQSNQVLKGFLSGVVWEITKSLKKGDRVTITGFGTFSRRSLSARAGRDPRAAQPKKVPSSYEPIFTAGQELTDYVSGEKKLPKFKDAASKVVSKVTESKKTRTTIKAAAKPRRVAKDVANEKTTSSAPSITAPPKPQLRQAPKEKIKVSRPSAAAQEKFAASPPPRETTAVKRSSPEVSKEQVHRHSTHDIQPSTKPVGNIFSRIWTRLTGG